MTNSSFFKSYKTYNKCIKFYDAVNYIYLDEISKISFKKISGYNKAKFIYKKIDSDFALVNKLIKERDLLNAATILRSTFENVMYIISTSFCLKFKVDMDINPGEYRRILEEHSSELFGDMFKGCDFNNYYKYLCKMVHPTSMKELLSYMNNTKKYRNYVLNNLYYLLLVIECMYLDFLSIRTLGKSNDFDYNLLDFSTYINLLNFSCFVNDVDKSIRYLKKYMCYDTNKRFLKDNSEQLLDIFKAIDDKKGYITIDIKELGEKIEAQLKENKYEFLMKSKS